MCHHIIGVKDGHVSNGQWMFHVVPRVIILMVKNLTIEINPMNFLILKTQNNLILTCAQASRPIFKHMPYFD